MTKTDNALQSELEIWHKDAADAPEAAAVLDRAARLVAGDELPPETWLDFLDITRRAEFLQALPDDAARRRWADVAIAAVRRTGFTLETLLDQRVAVHPDRTWLRRSPLEGDDAWSFTRAREKARAYAAAFLAAKDAPRVALLTPNRPRGAFCDLACLLHGILITPLSPHTDVETLTWICDTLDINVVVTGGEDQAALAAAAREGRGDMVHFCLEDAPPAGSGARSLEEFRAMLPGADIDEALARHPRFGLDDVCTVMFTSGSTGRPKGVEFSLYNLVSKRFARAAALPAVGRDEVMLCYLPLFHTFGRYLELLGSLFWGGTYVFVGNNSRATLLALLQQVEPTGLISIPLRWTEIRESCLARLDASGAGSLTDEDVRAVIGRRLRWGLSAAGYLDPRVFRFFQRHGVDLCSGFGMTEATGGITMTPPGDYRDDSVGVPLPGVNVRLTEQGEMQISGPYIASYLDEDTRPGDGSWLSTGDLFRQDESGHLQIVDRIKDIYKNVRGQTVAPRRVEQRFAEVPGIRRTFLVGDHRVYNVLLIVPDPDDPVQQGDPHGQVARDYFHRIVNAANRDLLPYERVVNFAVLDRDFDAERGELTPKGSYRRKAIEENFQSVVDELYLSDHVDLPVGDLVVRLPRWFHRDLGVLETDVVAVTDRLRNRVDGRELEVVPADEGMVRVGDLLYEVAGNVVDLGRLTRQPLLWAGNPQLATFCPVRDGWDTALGGYTQHVYLPWRETSDGPPAPADPPLVSDNRLPRLHLLFGDALLGGGERALKAVAELEKVLDIGDHRTSELIRRRLEALARHPEMKVRCAAYRVLLLDEPSPDFSEVRPKFLSSGLPFLDRETIEAVTRDAREGRRLDSFRRRLHTYRLHLDWPASGVMHTQFEGIFTLLADFVRNQPDYYVAVRDELISWILLDEDPVISGLAERTALDLGNWYESWLDGTLPHRGPGDWRDKILYQDGLASDELERLDEILVGTTFLQQSVRLITGGEVLDMRDVPTGGIWVGRTAVRHHKRIYRLSVNTVTGKHYDLLVVIWDRDFLARDRDDMLATIYWLIALGGHPHGMPVLPRFGCFRPAIGALSLAFVSDLSVWERIREYAGDRREAADGDHALTWRHLFVTAFATFLRGWRISGERIVPGMVTPTNVAVPEPDFREGARVLSLTGWRRYEDPLSLVQPILHNFYKQTAVTYPWLARHIDLRWICDACLEAMDPERAEAFLGELQALLADNPPESYRGRLARTVADYRERMQVEPYLSCALHGAVARFGSWERSNPDASPTAREQLVDEMLRLYGLNAQPDIARYQLYRRTWFASADPEIRAAFDVLLRRLHAGPGRTLTDLVEISDLQALLTSPEDRRAFRRMVFPHAHAAQRPELLTVGQEEDRHVVVATQVTDKTGAGYTVREPLSPAEYGQLYRLFFKAGYYKTISDVDRFFVALDEQEQIIGGISWNEVDPAVVHLNGIVVVGSLLGRGISSVLIEDFCARLADLGYAVVKTLFVLRPFFERHGFHLDKRWGGLVRVLKEDT
jgi:long-subunit acyl-CoA synthetase (AMP-forming)